MIGKFFTSSIFLSLIVLLAGWLAGIVTNTFYIDIGTPNRADNLFISSDNNGFYNPEVRPNAPAGKDNTFRWTSQTATLELPETLLLTPWKATLQVSSPRPGILPDQTGTTLKVELRDEAKDQEIGHFPVPSTADGTDISFEIMPQLSLPNSGVQLRLETSTVFNPGHGDNRALGLVLYHLKLDPDYSSYGFMGWLGSLALPMMITLIALASRGFAWLMGGNRFWQVLSQLAIGAFLVTSVVYWQELFQSAYLPTMLAVLAVFMAFWMARWFTARVPEVPAPFIYSACCLAALPLVQIAFNRLDFTKRGDVAVAGYEIGALALVIMAALVAGKYFEPLLVWIFTGAAALSFATLNWIGVFESQYHGFDFKVNYLKQLDLDQLGQPLYNVASIVASPGSAVRMPPTFTLLYWLLEKMHGGDVQKAIFDWRIFNELLLIPTIYILYKLAGELKHRLPVVIFFVLSFRQLAYNIDLAQINNVLLFCLALAALLVKNRRDTLAGLVIALPIWLKLIPGVGILFFLLEKRWKALAGFIAASAIINGLVILVVGWPNFWYYYTTGMWGVNQPEIGVVGQSLWGFIGRLGVDEVQQSFTQHFPAWAMPLGYSLSLLIMGLTLLVVWRSPAQNWLDSLLKLNSLLVMSLVISPFTWKHYAIMLLGGIVILAVALTRRGTPAMSMIFGLAYSILAFDQDFLFFPDMATGLAKFSSSDFFFALFALWGLNLWLVMRPRLVQRETAPQLSPKLAQVTGLQSG